MSDQTEHSTNCLSDGFKIALEAAGKSGERSRQVIYFAILIEFFCLFATRQTIFPKWTHLRVGAMRFYEDCPQFPASPFSIKLEGMTVGGVSHPLSDSAPSSKAPASPIKGSDPALRPDSLCARLKEAYADAGIPAALFDYRKRDLFRISDEELSVPVPIIGARVDVNDIWIFVGPMTLIVYLVVIFALRADADTIQVALDLANEEPAGPARKLLETTYVLGRRLTSVRTGRRSRSPDITGFHFVRYLLIFLPLLNILTTGYVDFRGKEGSLTTTPLLFEAGEKSVFLAHMQIALEAASFILAALAVLQFNQTFRELRSVTNQLNVPKQP